MGSDADLAHNSFRDLFDVTDDGWALLNHGGFGRVSVPVRSAQAHHLRRVEAAPNRFFSGERHEAHRRVRERLARFLHVDADDLALVPNATFGLNILAHSAAAAGWSTLGTSLDYDGVRAMWDQLASSGATHRRIDIDVCDPDPTATLVRALDAPVDLAVVPHIVSATGALLDVATLARATSAYLAVDGAHGPGQLDLDITSLGVAAYVGDLHKWVCAPRGTAFLWVSPELSPRLTWPVSSVSTIVPSRDLGARLDWLGTNDPSAWLSIPDALDLWEHRLAPARASTSYLTHSTSAALSDLGWSELVTSDEVLMRTYLAPPGTDAGDLRRDLDSARVDAPVIEHDDHVMLRVSFAWYVTPDDTQRLLAALAP